MPEVEPTPEESSQQKEAPEPAPKKEDERSFEESPVAEAEVPESPPEKDAAEDPATQEAHGSVAAISSEPSTPQADSEGEYRSKYKRALNEYDSKTN